MITSRQLADLYERLEIEPAVLFGTGAKELLASQPEVLEHVGTEQEISSIDVDEAILLALRCMSHLEARISSQTAAEALVGTFPGNVDVPARRTRMVVREMLQSSREEVVIFGFEISEEEVVHSLAEASVRANIVIVIDRSREVKRFLVRHWPDWAKEPRILANCEREGEGRFAKMHSKAIIVDGEDALLTSANLTFHGFRENIELGIRVRGEIARRARELLDEMLTAGLLEASPFRGA